MARRLPPPVDPLPGMAALVGGARQSLHENQSGGGHRRASGSAAGHGRVGCRLWSWSPIAKHVGPRGEVVAMDIQAGMLERAREKAAAANLANIRFLEGELGEGKLGRNRFDRSLLLTVL